MYYLESYYSLLSLLSQNRSQTCGMSETFEDAYFTNLVHFLSMDSIFQQCAISKNSLGFVEAESIIPEWLFKTPVMVNSERIEFQINKKSRAVVYTVDSTACDYFSNLRKI